MFGLMLNFPSRNVEKSELNALLGVVGWKLARYEAHLKENPRLPSSDIPPYNPAFGGILNDNDMDIFRGRIIPLKEF